MKLHPLEFISCPELLEGLNHKLKAYKSGKNVQKNRKLDVILRFLKMRQVGLNSRSVGMFVRPPQSRGIMRRLNFEIEHSWGFKVAT